MVGKNDAIYAESREFLRVSKALNTSSVLVDNGSVLWADPQTSPRSAIA
jgi:hypothetical protein